jgi:hypothetical protein
MTSSEDTAKRPRVLLVYYTYTQQSKLVAEAMAEALRGRGCGVSLALIGFTDKRWSERFSRRPLRHAWLDVFGMLPAQLRGATGEIEIPPKRGRAITTSSASAGLPGFSGRAFPSARSCGPTTPRSCSTERGSARSWCAAATGGRT